MSQKELLYVEDAVGHERIIQASIEEIVNQLDDENLVDYMKEELKTHQEMEEELMNLLEDVKNE